jgi:hypothetical protein
LRGGPRPCADWACRKRRLDELIRFAALYADQILIPDPFWDFDLRVDDPWTRRSLLDDLAGLGELRPLMEAGIVG